MELMRIGIIGGLDRNEARLTRLAEEAGHELMTHTGHMTGGGSPRIDTICERCDLVVIVTEINSHNAVLRARRLLRERGREPLLVRKLGASKLQQIMSAPLAQAA
jgi:hypothetical protein